MTYLAIASLIIAVGVGRWVPSVVSLYGCKYFGWPGPARPRPLFRLLAVTATLLIGRTFALGLAPMQAPFLALILVALAGVIAADARFQVIPDRFQWLGLIGAVGFVAAPEWPAFDLYADLVPHVVAGGGLALALLLLNAI